MSASRPAYTNVAVADVSLADLDRLVADALAAGRRPMGRRASRGTVLAELIAEAAQHLKDSQRTLTSPQ